MHVGPLNITGPKTQLAQVTWVSLTEFMVDLATLVRISNLQVEMTWQVKPSDVELLNCFAT